MIVRVHGSSLSHRADQRKVIGAIVVLWLCLIGVNIPTLLSHTTKIFNCNYTYCGLHEGAIGPLIYTFFAFGYAVPLTVIGVLYIRIVLFLKSKQSG